MKRVVRSQEVLEAVQLTTGNEGEVLELLIGYGNFDANFKKAYQEDVISKLRSNGFLEVKDRRGSNITLVYGLWVIKDQSGNITTSRDEMFRKNYIEVK